MLTIKKRLAEDDPSNSVAQRELGETYTHLGMVFLMLHRTDDALAQFENGLKIRCTLAEADPRDAQKQRDLMVSHNKLGEVAFQAGNYDDAAAKFQEGIAVLDRMIENGQSVAASTNEKAFLQRRIQFSSNAKLAFGEWDRLLKADAEVLPELLRLRATAMLKRRELASAMQAGDELRELDPKDKYNLYNVACAYARYAEFVTKDKPTPTDAEQAERKTFLDLTLATLKASLAAGWDDFSHMKKDDDLKPLRGMPEFEALFPQ